MLVFHESLVLIVVGIGAILAGDLAPVGSLNKFGDEVVLIFGRVDEGSAEFYPHSVKFFGVNTTANSISAFKKQMGDVLLREGLGSTDA